MASCPTTLVLFTTDKINFPLKHVLVVVKHLFQYGVKEVSLKEDKIFLSLTYSPKGITLKKKFGNLPVRYMRTKLDDKVDFRILEKIVKRYKFNLLDEEVPLPALTDGKKRKLTIEEVFSSDSSCSSVSDSEDDDHEPQLPLQQQQSTKKEKRKRRKIANAATVQEPEELKQLTTTTTSTLDEEQQQLDQ